tara:strand:+ start:17331 stop:17579 length:249 start_codon:yes stop_codon:yes gene_type:complete
MTTIEPLKIDDIIEVREIKKILAECKSNKNLLSTFALLESIANKSINNGVSKMITYDIDKSDTESDEDLDLSDHDSDEEDEK